MTRREEEKLDELLDRDAGLSGGEIDFLESLDAHYRDAGLTERQSAWLQAIWTRVCDS